MLADVFRWWVEQLRPLMPGLSSAEAAARDALIVEAAGQGEAGLALVLRQRGTERALGRLAGTTADRETMRAAGRRTVVVRLPHGVLLERELWLPLAAEREMLSALGYEIDRATPFRPEAVFWSGEVIRRDHRRGRLLVRLLLVPRAVAAPLVDAATAAGLPPGILEGCGADGTRRRLVLAGTAWRPWQGGTLAGAALACALLAIALVAVPPLRQASRQAAVEARIRALQPQFREAEALQQRLEQDAAGSDILTASQAEFGTALGILATVTALLPDDTFLTDLTLKQRQLLLRGQSANAARLIATLAADPAIRNPSFAAPVTRAAAGGPDLFSITADAAP